MCTRAKRVEFDEDKNVPTCGICEQNLAYSSCPLCQTPYCNILCYREHSGKNCLERFLKYMYKVVDEYFATENKQGSSKRVSLKDEYQDILEQLFSKPMPPQTKLAKRVRELIAKIDSLNVCNKGEMLEKLTPAEKALYHRLMKDASIKSERRMFITFWDRGFDPTIKKRSLYDDAEDPPYMTEYPQYPLGFIPPLAEVTKVKPSPSFFGNLCNLLAVYSIVVRYYDGEHLEPYAMESAKQICMISGIFISHHSFASKTKAIRMACRRAFLSRYLDLDLVKVEKVTEDVNMILRGPCADDASYYILYALGNIRQIFSECNDLSTSRWMKKENFNCSAPAKSPVFITPPPYDILNLCFKKINHLYSYVLSYYSSDWAIIDGYEEYKDETLEFRRKRP